MSDNENKENAATPETSTHFIEDIIDADLAAGKNDGRVATRFPPEPNGYLHIGHAKSICLNFGLAQKYGGTCNLRFDDTNPATEDVEYIDAIQEDVRWLGFDWGDRLYYASDYFEQMYEYALVLIRAGKAYVEALSVEEIREYRGNFTTPGRESPWRDRPVAENLDLFARMRKGEFKDGELCLRARIDMQSPNMNLRDPVMYRIRHAHHHRTQDDWCIYPMYDWAHGLEDAIEGITHSLCTLEFENHRPLYDWFLEQLPIHRPQQIEFARLNLSYTVMSKRRLLKLVEQQLVTGWDDPRMPTITGMRRRGYSPAALRRFAERVGLARRDGIVDMALLEHTVREDLNETTPRVMAVLNPLKVTIENYPEGEEEFFEAPLHPEKPEFGTRQLPFSRHLYIERDDFREDPPKKWHRLSPGAEIRLRYACLIRCNEVIKDASGEVVELKCTFDPDSRGGNAPDGRRVRGTSHWVSATHALPARVRLYDRLFRVENPLKTEEGGDFVDNLNPQSLEELRDCRVEPYLATLAPEARVQFERLGYFVADRHEFRPDDMVFNRAVSLRDSWARIERSQPTGPSSANRGQRRAAEKQGAQPSAPAPAAKTETKPQAAAPAASPAEITIDDFARLDLRVGVVVAASEVAGAKKLLQLQVDIGEARPRQIMAGIRARYDDPSQLVGKKVIVVANLKPRQMKFGLSEGMLLAGASEDGTRLELAELSGDILPGDTVA
ncbi:MAG: glutamine--tRNA ligase/YqeY domain fusion protein [Myxococcales bacterium]|jgi:glutaminyl-tRNA synthetase|nr:glutamine--tRNA ligase/YqeY domain fusion protein [Myxococcales bacterium]